MRYTLHIGQHPNQTVSIFHSWNLEWHFHWDTGICFYFKLCQTMYHIYSLRWHYRQSLFSFMFLNIFPNLWLGILVYLILYFNINDFYIWAASWQNQRSDCAPSENSDQPGHPPSLIRVFACAQWVAKDPMFLHADSEDWSDWADVQADLSLRWAHSHFVGFVTRRLIYLFQHGCPWMKWTVPLETVNVNAEIITHMQANRRCWAVKVQRRHVNLIYAAQYSWSRRLFRIFAHAEPYGIGEVLNRIPRDQFVNLWFFHSLYHFAP